LTKKVKRAASRLPLQAFESIFDLVSNLKAQSRMAATTTIDLHQSANNRFVSHRCLIGAIEQEL